MKINQSASETTNKITVLEIKLKRYKNLLQQQKEGYSTKGHKWYKDAGIAYGIKDTQTIIDKLENEIKELK